MSGIIAVYALVVSVLIAQDLQPPASGSYSLFKCVPSPEISLLRVGIINMSTAASCTLHAGSQSGLRALQLVTALALWVTKGCGHTCFSQECSSGWF